MGRFTFGVFLICHSLVFFFAKLIWGYLHIFTLCVVALLLKLPSPLSQRRACPTCSTPWIMIDTHARMYRGASRACWEDAWRSRSSAHKKRSCLPTHSSSSTSTALCLPKAFVKLHKNVKVVYRLYPPIHPHLLSTALCLARIQN